MTYMGQWKGYFMALTISALRLRMQLVRGHFVIEQVQKFTRTRIECEVCHGAFLY